MSSIFNTSEISKQYKLLSPEERADLQAECDRSSLAKQSAHHTGGSFGPKSRQHDRALSNAAFQRHCESVRQNLCLTNAELHSTDLCIQTSLGAVLSKPVHHHGSLARLIADARLHMKVLNFWRSQDNAASLKELQSWHDTYGKQNLQMLIDQVPSLVDVKSAIAALPAPEPVFKYVGDETAMAELATVIGSSVAEGRGDDRSKEALIADIDSRCAPVMEKDSRRIVDDPKKGQRKPPCNSVGLCISCSARGCKLYNCRNGFLRNMKTSLATKELKADVDNRLVFLRISSCSVGLIGNDLASLELEELVGVVRKPAGVVWACIGAHSWSPYRPCFKYYEPSPVDRERVVADEVFLTAIRSAVQN